MKTLKISILITLLLCTGLSTQAAEGPNAAENTRTLIHALGCKGCHVIGEKGGTLAPDLSRIGSRMTARQIREVLVTGVSDETKGFMPSYATTPEDHLQAISNYLYHLR